MTDRIESRLAQLRTEYQNGQERLAALENEAAKVSNAMLRISGAVQVLEELLAQGEAAQERAAASSNGSPVLHGLNNG